MKTKKDKQSIIDKLILNKWIYLILTLAFILAAIFLFGWAANKYDWTSPIDYSLFGALGDFIGGVLGTILMLLSTLLVVRTFIYQQSVTQSNERQLETQRFNNLFFELMNLYHREVAELCGQDFKFYRTPNEEDNGELVKQELRYDDKDFFDVSKEKLQQMYQNGNSFTVNRKLAVRLYMDFYIKNKTKMGAYFRTLYRIYDLIDNADLEESSKKNYLKIVRAQLTESELFFLRYNAMTYYGMNFVKYINKYNILKHLPAFELLEFKDWWNKPNQTEKTGINIIFDFVNRRIRDMLCDIQKLKDTVNINSISPKYSMRLDKKSPYDLLITVIINKTAKNDKVEFSALDNFDNKKIQQLLDCFIKEVIMFSNFEQYNETKELEAYSDPITDNKDIVIINSGIRNKMQKPLKVTSDLIRIN